MTGSLYGQKARSKFVMVIKRGVLMSVVAAMTISGCDFDPQAMNAKITALDARIAKLEVASALPSTRPAPSIPTVLWVQNPGAYPRASSYYSSKEECAQTAAMWGFTDDKSARQIGTDPWITHTNKKDQFGQPAQLVVSCLPQGVQPYERNR
jgi:hypothetical protein